MEKLYMGLDVGTVSTKGVIIDKYDNIIASAYLYTEGDPIRALKRVIKKMEKDINLDKYRIVGIGTTGCYRKLSGSLLDSVVIKNEVISQVTGTVKLYPNVKTIIEIGGEDAKIMIVEDGKIIDYTMNTSCMSGMGSFIDFLAKRLNVNIDDVGKMALKSNREVDIKAKCVVFANASITDKIQAGCSREDILMGVSKMIANNYINNVMIGKKISGPIIFNGGVSRNEAVVKSLEEIIGKKIIVSKNACLMGALGVAIMTRENKKEKIFDFNIDNYRLETKIINCLECHNKCEVVNVYKNNKLIDHWGNKCEKGNEICN